MQVYEGEVGIHSDDDSVERAVHVSEWIDIVVKAAATVGFTVDLSTLKTMAEEAGFVDVKVCCHHERHPQALTGDRKSSSSCHGRRGRKTSG